MMIVLLLVSVTANAKGGHGRLNVSRVMSNSEHHLGDDDTTAGIWSGSVEADTYYGTEYVTPTVNFTTKDKFNIALSMQNIPISGGGAQNYEGALILSAVKFQRLNDYFAMMLGAQSGYALLNLGGEPLQFQSFEFVDIHFRPLHWLIFRAGPYHANAVMTTTVEKIGYMTGVELHFDTIRFNLDYISGHNNVSGATATVTYAPNHDWNFYVGVGVPEQNSGNEFYGITGISFPFY